MHYICNCPILLVVSIHAPARGATYPGATSGERSEVSIHAPARGATDAPTPVTSTRTGFNPRAREGRD